MSFLPKRIKTFLGSWRRRLKHKPPLGLVRFGQLRRTKPISSDCGFDRGQPIDRYYIEKFLAEHAKDIKGRVLEIADSNYTRRFGQNKVSDSEVLHVGEGGSQVTIVGDLVSGTNIPEERYDCIILTQTLQFIYNFRAALMNVYKALRPEGVLFATVPSISHISRYDMDRWGDYWRFTNLSIEKIFKEIFSQNETEIRVYGNVLTATAFLQGIVAEELKKEELDLYDRDYPVLIAIKAFKGKKTR